MEKDFFADVYAKPYCRVGAYAAGMALGYFLHSTERRVYFRKVNQPCLWYMLKQNDDDGGYGDDGGNDDGGDNDDNEVEDGSGLLPTLHRETGLLQEGESALSLVHANTEWWW